MIESRPPQQQPPSSEHPHSHLKQRIIGAIVLVALIIIFVPMLLQKSPSNSELVANLAQRPVIEKTNFPTKDSFNKAAEPSSSAALPAQAWVVQLGSFSQKHTADDLVAQLRTYGFVSYTYQTTINNQSVIRVYAGPEVQKAQAQQLLENIQAKIGIKGQLVPFDPLNS